MGHCVTCMREDKATLATVDKHNNRPRSSAAPSSSRSASLNRSSSNNKPPRSRSSSLNRCATPGGAGGVGSSRRVDSVYSIKSERQGGGSGHPPLLGNLHSDVIRDSTKVTKDGGGQSSSVRRRETLPSLPNPQQRSLPQLPVKPASCTSLDCTTTASTQTNTGGSCRHDNNHSTSSGSSSTGGGVASSLTDSGVGGTSSAASCASCTRLHSNNMASSQVTDRRDNSISAALNTKTTSTTKTGGGIDSCDVMRRSDASASRVSNNSNSRQQMLQTANEDNSNAHIMQGQGQVEDDEEDDLEQFLRGEPDFSKNSEINDSTMASLWSTDGCNFKPRPNVFGDESEFDDDITPIERLGRLTDGFLPCDEDMMSQILDLCVSSVDESFFSGDEDDVDMFADGGRDDVAQAVLQQALRDFSRQMADQIERTTSGFLSSGCEDEGVESLEHSTHGLTTSTNQNERCDNTAANQSATRDCNGANQNSINRNGINQEVDRLSGKNAVQANNAVTLTNSSDPGQSQGQGQGYTPPSSSTAAPALPVKTKCRSTNNSNQNSLQNPAKAVQPIAKDINNQQQPLVEVAAVPKNSVMTSEPKNSNNVRVVKAKTMDAIAASVVSAAINGGSSSSRNADASDDNMSLHQLTSSPKQKRKTLAATRGGSFDNSMPAAREPIKLQDLKKPANPAAILPPFAPSKAQIESSVKNSMKPPLCANASKRTTLATSTAIGARKNVTAAAIGQNAIYARRISAFGAKLLSIYENCLQAKRSFNGVQHNNMQQHCNNHNNGRAVSSDRSQHPDDDINWPELLRHHHQNYSKHLLTSSSSSSFVQELDHRCTGSNLGRGQGTRNSNSRQPSASTRMKSSTCSIVTSGNGGGRFSANYNNRKPAFNKSCSVESDNCDECDGDSLGFSTTCSSCVTSRSNSLLPGSSASRARCYCENEDDADVDVVLSRRNAAVISSNSNRGGGSLMKNGNSNTSHSSAPVPPPRSSSQGRCEWIVGRAAERHSINDRNHPLDSSNGEDRLLHSKLKNCEDDCSSKGQQHIVSNGYCGSSSSNGHQHRHQQRPSSEERELAWKQLREKIRRERAQQLAEERRDLTTDDDGELTNGRRSYGGRRGRAGHMTDGDNAIGQAAEKYARGLAYLAREIMTSNSPQFENQLYEAVMNFASGNNLHKTKGSATSSMVSA